MCVKQKTQLQDHQVLCHCGHLRRLPFPSSLPFLCLPFSVLPCSFPPSCPFPTLKYSVWTLTSQSTLCYSTVGCSGGALECAGMEERQGHPRVLRVVAIYQPVQNFFQYFNSWHSPPRAHQCAWHGVTKTVGPKTLLTAEGHRVSPPCNSPGGLFHRLRGTPGGDFTGLLYPFIYDTPSGLDSCGVEGTQKRTCDHGEETSGGASLTQPKREPRARLCFTTHTVLISAKPHPNHRRT